MSAPKITENWVRLIAPNAAALRNGNELRSRFLTLNIADNRLLFGDCPGSGKEPYTVSADLSVPESPVCRCTCPSRQTPCKHVLGLLLAYAEEPGKFSDSPMPTECPSQPRTAKPQRRAASPVRSEAQKNALRLDGLNLALRMAEGLVWEGLGALTGKRLHELRTQSRALGNYYLPGVQTAFSRILRLLSEGLTHDASRRAAFEELAFFSFLCRRAQTYFGQTPVGSGITDAALETWCGRVWHLKELEDLGLCVYDARLLQLAFFSIDNPDSGVLEDTGYWAVLGETDALCLTQTLRPREALAHVREEDSCFGIIHVPKLYRYPTGLRARWDGFSLTEPTPEDFETLLSLSESLSPALRRFRRSLQDPYEPRVMPSIIRLGALETDTEGGFWLRDTDGACLKLTDAPDAPACLLPLALDESHNAVFVLLSEHPDGFIVGQALSLLSPDSVTRLGG